MKQNVLWSLVINEKIKLKNFSTELESNIVNYFIKHRIDHYLLEGGVNTHYFSNNSIYKLNKSIEKNNLKNLILFDAGIKIGNRLSQDKIDYVFLKGFNLINYGFSLNERPLRDIDILINPDHINIAISSLKRLGFQFRNNKAKRVEIINNGYNYDIPPLVNKSGVVIEIHYKINPKSMVSPCELGEEILRNKKNIVIYNKTLSVCDENHLFLHLVFHGTKKDFFNAGPMFIIDLIKLFEKKEVEISKILDISLKLNLYKETILSLNLIAEKNNKIKDYITRHNLKLNREIVNSAKYLVLNRTSNEQILRITYEKNLYRKIQKVFKLFFISREQVSREFLLNKNNSCLLFYYPRRWIRQIKTFRPQFTNELNKKNLQMKNSIKSIDNFLN